MALDLTEILGAAMRRLGRHARLVGLANTNEFTFRSFFLAEVMKACAQARCQTEWHRVDLLIQEGGRNTLIEFKFYVWRRTVGLDGEASRRKGGASPKSEREFDACVTQLHHSGFGPIHGKFLVLVYERGDSPHSKYSFQRSYDSLAVDSRIRRIETISHAMADRLTCKLLEIA